MKPLPSPIANALVGLFLIGVVVAIMYFVPAEKLSWGSLSFAQQETVTVTGFAQKQESNQVAEFNAGVNARNVDKDAAIKQVNDAMTTIVQSIKDFGIAAEDIQTQNLSVYKYERPPFEAVSGSDQPQWEANNSIRITLRDITRAQELAGVLTSSGATNVYGPNFHLDDTSASEGELLQKAIVNAREKAQKVAESSGQELGEMVTVVEGGGNYSPIFAAMESRGMGGGGAPVEGGSSTVSKTVTVTFELK